MFMSTKKTVARWVADSMVRGQGGRQGWLVTWGNGISPQSWFPIDGGSWSGGQQTNGTSQIRAPRDPRRIAAFLRELCAYEGEGIKVVVDYVENPASTCKTP